ncbi:Nramp family divalent metal transporter [Thalassoroseus pseudoceratinae]|uniref:Nramp family divalent metal transporter n=1 Tax=Thalassoroseus pseudoceratinae TaxID=2713176 RepID=UPI00141E20C5|nr:Nramp family divalent metal transporter [Thalassoroseus pseudoceratinae]
MTNPDDQPILDEHDTLPPSQDPAVAGDVQEPPRGFVGILKQLGPGLIIAGSIVGSGELIATTKTGAQAGITLLWLILIGCVIKVFVQVELGRYAITHGETTLSALDRVPGPRLKANWIVWCWLAMMVCGVGQLGGIVGGVGQAMAIAVPLSGDYAKAIQMPSEKELRNYLKWQPDTKAFQELSPEQQARLQNGQRIQEAQFEQLRAKDRPIDEALELTTKLVKNEAALKTDPSLEEVIHNQKKKLSALLNPSTNDDKYWAAFAALLTVALLYRGRYGLLQNVSLVLVVTFTFITIGNVLALQSTEEFHISADQFWKGLSFRLPESVGGINPLMTALATFGIIGVGATELITYPYWCLEKGYAKFTGQRTDEESWANRARGWMRVMHYDALLSMVVYTVATLAFFVMGAAVLYSEGRDPDNMRMVSTLATAYVPVFGEYAKWLFLGGAVAVLYSTFLVANAGHSRMLTDGLKVYGLIDKHSESTHQKSIRNFGIALPLTCLAIYWAGVNPVSAVILSGVAQSLLLPMIGFGALYFRKTATDPRLKPSRAWDVALVVSFLGLLIVGVWGLYGQIAKLM